MVYGYDGNGKLTKLNRLVIRNTCDAETGEIPSPKTSGEQEKPVDNGCTSLVLYDPDFAAAQMKKMQPDNTPVQSVLYPNGRGRMQNWGGGEGEKIERRIR